LTGCSKETFRSTRALLITVGIIEITKLGGRCRGDMHQYRILLEKCGNVTRDEERWRIYPRENWSDEVPTSPNNLVGVKTRFKNNSTLKDYTLNDSNPPNELTPNDSTDLHKPLTDYTHKRYINRYNHQDLQEFNEEYDK